MTSAKSRLVFVLPLAGEAVPEKRHRESERRRREARRDSYASGNSRIVSQNERSVSRVRVLASFAMRLPSITPLIFVAYHRFSSRIARSAVRGGDLCALLSKHTLATIAAIDGIVRQGFCNVKNLQI